jgi:hypothetical protein
MFYFAAASFAEMARRLGAARSTRFLCADDPQLGSATIRLSPDRTTKRGLEYREAVAAAIEPMNVAGLCDAGKRNWYGIDLDDAVRGAAKFSLDAGWVRDRLAAMLTSHSPTGFSV